jgi:hypothetical protein
MNKVLHEWFTAMHSAGKPETGPMITDKAIFDISLTVRHY